MPWSQSRYFSSARVCTYSRTFRFPGELYSIQLVLRSNLTSLKILRVWYFLIIFSKLVTKLTISVRIVDA